MTLARRLVLSLLVLGLGGAAIGAATSSAFSSTTANPSNSFAAGTVFLSDNDAGSSLLSLSSAAPGTSASGCIKVTYGGSLPASVRLYASTTGSLAQYLNLTVTRGTDPAPSFPSCSGFSPDSSDYTGAGPGVVYSGTLSNFTASYTSFASGLADPQTWNANDAHSYRFTVTLPSSAPAAAQGLASSATFTWEAQNR